MCTSRPGCIHMGRSPGSPGPGNLPADVQLDELREVLGSSVVEAAVDPPGRRSAPVPSQPKVFTCIQCSHPLRPLVRRSSCGPRMATKGGGFAADGGSS